MAKVEYNNFTNEYVVTLDDGTKEKVSWNAWHAINKYQHKQDMRKEAEFRTEYLNFHVTDEWLNKIVEYYERNYRSNRFESWQWDEAVEAFLTKTTIEKYFGENYGDVEMETISYPTLGDFMYHEHLDKDNNLYSLQSSLVDSCDYVK